MNETHRRMRVDLESRSHTRCQPQVGDKESVMAECGVCTSVMFHHKNHLTHSRVKSPLSGRADVTTEPGQTWSNKKVCQTKI